MEGGMPPTMMSAAPVMMNAPQQGGSVAAPAIPAAPADNDKTLKVNAPMVGTFYRSPAPDAKAFIQEGVRIEVGQVFCIIEAMKLMNEIKSEVSGKIVKILVANGQAVEFGQPILVVDPS
jgi:acetyl-CoA carboxylase biotin carboxyl carrier protein